MAKIIYAYSRKDSFDRHTEERLEKICKRLEPDNLRLPAQHKVIVKGNLAFAIINNRSSQIKDDSVLLGSLYGEDGRWEKPQEKYPDGSYAIFRSDRDLLEAVSDAAASRTIWYFFDEERFVASTSQRAMILLLGSLEFDNRVIPWMLSTGSLGPDLSWDKRIKRLPPDSSVVLDKARWTISVNVRPIMFSPKARPDSEHRRMLEDKVRTVIQSIACGENINFNDYVLPLSGGYDSRGILCFLAEHRTPENLRTITWGLEENLVQEGNDAAVAKELAATVGVKHRYHHTDVGRESLEKIIDRFVCCGEGRIDHLAGYLDGLEIWRKLLEEDAVGGIIRGDEGFGWIPVSSELTARLSVGMGLCADYRNLENVLRKFQLPRQEIPAGLRRQKGETLNAWRDRLYHAYRLPTILAALSDIKLSYVEIINPLLARSILHCVRELPDKLRTDKVLFKEIVNAIAPPVPYAQEGANASLTSMLRKRELVRLMRDELHSERAQRIFSGDFLEYISRQMREENVTGEQKGGKRWGGIRSLAPRSLKNWFRDFVAKPGLDGNVLAFRVFLILRMHEILNRDCADLIGTSAVRKNSAVAVC